MENNELMQKYLDVSAIVDAKFEAGEYRNLQPTPKQSTMAIAEQIYAVALSRDKCTEPEEIKAHELELERLFGVDLANKSDSIGWVDKQIDFQIAALKSEREDISAKISSLENAKKRVRKTVVRVMEILGVDKIVGKYTTIYVSPGEDSPVIEDEAKILPRYLVPTTTYVIDKELIKFHLQNGVEVPGARLKTGEDYITIRRAKGRRK